MQVRRVETISRSPEETHSIGKTLGEHAEPGHVFLLVGGLGAGKTSLTRGVLWGLGTEEYARSPTFVLIAQYPGRLTLYHVDLYRLETADEVLELGLDEYLYGGGVCVVEWADRAPGAFPENHLQIKMEHVDETTRRLSLSATSEDHAGLVDAVSARRPNGRGAA